MRVVAGVASASNSSSSSAATASSSATSAVEDPLGLSFPAPPVEFSVSLSTFILRISLLRCALLLVAVMLLHLQGVPAMVLDAVKHQLGHPLGRALDVIRELCKKHNFVDASVQDAVDAATTVEAAIAVPTHHHRHTHCKGLACLNC